MLIAAAVAHLAIHWRWIKNVTRKFFVSLLPQREASPQAPAAARTPVSGGQ